MRVKNLRLIVLSAVSAAVFYSSAPADAANIPSDPWPHAVSDVPAHPLVRFGLLPNGMQYAILHNATPPGQASLRLRIDAGSLMESDDQQGIAHFVEHMVFNGTDNMPENEMIRTLERLGLAFGADTNAFVSFDQTVYQLDIPRTDAKTVTTSLRILREQVSSALMDIDAIEAERGIILSEERLRNTPEFRSTREQLKWIALGQKIGTRMPIGDIEIIKNAPRETFLSFYNAYYRPSRATLVAVGDFDVDAMELHIREFFESWSPRGEDGPEPDPGIIAPRHAESKIIFEPGVQSFVQIGWTKAPDRTTDSIAKRLINIRRDIALNILNRRLREISSSSNSPFFSSGANVQTFFDSVEMVAIYAQFSPGQWENSISAIDQEHRRFVTFGATEHEIINEIEAHRANIENIISSSHTKRSNVIADQIANTSNDQIVFTSERIDLAIFDLAVSDLTVENFNNAIPSYFQGEGPLLLVVTSEAVPGGEAAVMSSFRKSQETVVTAPEPPAALEWPYTSFGATGEIKSRREIDEVGATIVTFVNGVVLTVKPTPFGDDQVRVEVRTGNGELDMQADHFSPQAMAPATFIAGGVSALTFDEISRILAGRIVSVDFSQNGDAYRLSGSTRPQDLDLQMQVLTAYLVDPGLREEPFLQMQSQYPQIIEQAMATPAGAFELQSQDLLSSGDKRQAPPPPEVVASWTNEELRNDVKRGLSKGPISVVMVGDVTVEAAISATASTLGALPPRTDTVEPALRADVRRFPQGGNEPIWVPHNGPDDHALAYVAWPTTDNVGDRTEARRVRLLAEVLQLRVNEEIRERQALSYAPIVGSNASEIYKDYGFIFINAQIPPQTVNDFYSAIENIVTDIQTKPPTEDELDRARLPLVEAVHRAQLSNEYWIENLALVHKNPNVIEEIQTTISDLNEVTTTDIQNLAQLYLRRENMWKAYSTANE